MSGFKGYKNDEFNRIFPKESFSKVTEEHNKKNRIRELNQYL